MCSTCAGNDGITLKLRSVGEHNLILKNLSSADEGKGSMSVRNAYQVMYSTRAMISILLYSAVYYILLLYGKMDSASTIR